MFSKLILIISLFLVLYGTPKYYFGDIYNITWNNDLFRVYNSKGQFSFIDKNKKQYFNSFFDEEKKFPFALFISNRFLIKVAKKYSLSDYKIVKWHEKWGVIHREKGIVLENIYDEIWGFIGKETGILKKENQYYKYTNGILNDLGKLYFSKELYCVFIDNKNSNKVFILDFQGNKIAENIPLNLVKNIAVKDFFDSKIARVSKGKKYYISNKGEILFFDDLFYRSSFTDKYAIGVMKQKNLYSIYKLNLLGEKIFLDNITSNKKFNGTGLSYPLQLSNGTHLYALKFYQKSSGLDFDQEGLAIDINQVKLPVGDVESFYFSLDLSIKVNDMNNNIFFDKYPLYWCIDFETGQYTLKSLKESDKVFSFLASKEFNYVTEDFKKWCNLSLPLPTFTENKLFVFDNQLKKFVCIDKQALKVFNKTFDIASQFYNKRCLVKDNGEYFFINEKGEKVIDLNSYDGSAFLCYSFGTFVYRKHKTYTEILAIDTKGNIILSFPEYKFKLVHLKTEAFNLKINE